MKALLLLGVVAPLVLGGCSQRLALTSPDRHAVLATCATAAVRTAHWRDRQGLHSAMLRLEACMAEQRLPGFAMYDARAHAVRYAYEADQPRLRF